ncbi:MAG: hypothetical protein KBC64_00215 [Simkaniaceae bacterium]|nr:hypothetical protein [Simkaniaceae bacterium]
MTPVTQQLSHPYPLCEVGCDALITSGAAVLFTSVGALPAAIFGASKAIFHILLQEGSNCIGLGNPSYAGEKLLKEVCSVVIPIGGAVAITSLVGFPMTFGTGMLLVLASLVAQIALYCFCAGGSCCVAAIAAHL